MEENGIWKEQFRLGAYMVGADRKLTLPMLSNLLQEVAGNHANARNLGFHDMQANNRFWVLNKIKIGVKEFPVWLSEVNISTWVSMMRGPFSNRHFAMHKEGVLLASAFSFWVAVNSDTLKPVRMNAEGVPIISDKEAACGPPDKLQPFDGGELIGTHVVQRSDIDMLGHVNNVKYTEWLLNQRSIDPGVKNIQINYLQEAKLGDRLHFYRLDNRIALKSEKDKVITLFAI